MNGCFASSPSVTIVRGPATALTHQQDDKSSGCAQQPQQPQQEYGPLPDDLANITLDSFDHLNTTTSTTAEQSQQPLFTTTTNLNLQQSYQNLLFQGNTVTTSIAQSFTFTLLPQQLPQQQQIFNLVVPNNTLQLLQQPINQTQSAVNQLCHNTTTTATTIMNLSVQSTSASVEGGPPSLQDLNDYVHKRYQNQAKRGGKASVRKASFLEWAKEAKAKLDPENRVKEFKATPAWLTAFQKSYHVSLRQNNKPAAPVVATVTESNNREAANGSQQTQASNRKPRKRQKTSHEQQPVPMLVEDSSSNGENTKTQQQSQLQPVKARASRSKAKTKPSTTTATTSSISTSTTTTTSTSTSTSTVEATNQKRLEISAQLYKRYCDHINAGEKVGRAQLIIWARELSGGTFRKNPGSFNVDVFMERFNIRQFRDIEAQFKERVLAAYHEELRDKGLVSIAALRAIAARIIPEVDPTGQMRCTGSRKWAVNFSRRNNLMIERIGNGGKRSSTTGAATMPENPGSDDEVDDGDEDMIENGLAAIVSALAPPPPAPKKRLRRSKKQPQSQPIVNEEDSSNVSELSYPALEIVASQPEILLKNGTRPEEIEDKEEEGEVENMEDSSNVQTEASTVVTSLVSAGKDGNNNDIDHQPQLLNPRYQQQQQQPHSSDEMSFSSSVDEVDAVPASTVIRIEMQHPAKETCGSNDVAVSTVTPSPSATGASMITDDEDEEGEEEDMEVDNIVSSANPFASTLASPPPSVPPSASRNSGTLPKLIKVPSDNVTKLLSPLPPPPPPHYNNSGTIANNNNHSKPMTMISIPSPPSPLQPVVDHDTSAEAATEGSISPTPPHSNNAFVSKIMTTTASSSGSSSPELGPVATLFSENKTVVPSSTTTTITAFNRGNSKPGIISIRRLAGPVRQSPTPTLSTLSSASATLSTTTSSPSPTKKVVNRSSPFVATITPPPADQSSQGLLSTLQHSMGIRLAHGLYYYALLVPKVNGFDVFKRTEAMLEELMTDRLFQEDLANDPGYNLAH